MTSPVSDGTPAEQPAPSPQKPEPAPPARPSSAQILASVLTATTTTFALSYLGVAGTIIGAGLASTFTVLANYWYTRSIMHTQRKVTQLAPKAVRARTTAQNPTAQTPTAQTPTAQAPTAQTATTAVITKAELAEDPLPAPAVDDAAQARRAEKLMAPARAGRRRFIVAIAVGFVLLLALVTAVELGLGKPLSDALRGQEGTGTSVFHNSAPRTPAQNVPGSGTAGVHSPKPDQNAGPADEPTTDVPDGEPSEQSNPDPTMPQPDKPDPTESAPGNPTPPAEPAEPVVPEAQGPTNTDTTGSADVPATPPTDDAGSGRTAPAATEDRTVFNAANKG